MAAAHAIVAGGIMVPAYLLTLRRTGVATGAILATWTRPLLGCLLVAGTAVLVHRIDSPVWQLLVGGVVGLSVYAFVVRSIRGTLQTRDLVEDRPLVEATA